MRKEVPIKRFRCTSCSGDGCAGKRTWSYFPPFVLYLMRYAANVVQACWESWASGGGYEATAEAEHVRCVRTVKHWLELVTQRSEELCGELRRMVGLECVEEPAEPVLTATGKANTPRRLAAKTVLDLTLRLLDRLTLHPADQLRVPYHFAMKAARVL